MVIRGKLFLFTLFMGIFLYGSVGATVNDTPCDASLLTVGCGVKNILSNTGLINSGRPAPACGNYAGSDIWVYVLVPASGNMNITTRSESLTDIAMAVYRENTSCSSTLTYLICDDNSGPDLMPEISITGETPGTKLYIRMWDKNNDEVGNFEIELTEPSDLYCLVSHAVMYNFPTDTCVQLTAAQANRQGCAWYKNTIDFSQNFDNLFRVYFGNDDNGADGMTFTFHNDPQGNLDCGIIGQQLGAGGLQNALVIEFDSFYNFHSSELWADHIAVWTSSTGHLAPMAGPVKASDLTNNIEDAVPHWVRLQWNAATTNLKIYFDFDLRLSVTNDFVTNVFGSKNVFWGSTGSTGASYNLQVVCLPILLSPLPVELIDFSTECNNGDVVLNWATATELNNDYFTLERSTDGINFEEIAVIPGHGTSVQSHEYQFIDKIHIPAYYRLLQTDFDGQNEYVGGIKYADCSEYHYSTLQTYPSPFHNKLTVHVPNTASKQLFLELFDVYGRRVYKDELEKKSNHILELDLKQLSSGTYLLRLNTDSKIYQSKIIKTASK